LKIKVKFTADNITIFDKYKHVLFLIV